MLFNISQVYLDLFSLRCIKLLYLNNLNKTAFLAKLFLLSG